MSDERDFGVRPTAEGSAPDPWFSLSVERDRSHMHRWQPSDIFAAIGRAPEVRVREVIEVRFRRGEGCCMEDPVRIVTAYFDPDGLFLAEHEPDSG